jgi:hypothetical protein
MCRCKKIEGIQSIPSRAPDNKLCLRDADSQSNENKRHQWVDPALDKRARKAPDDACGQ